MTDSTLALSNYALETLQRRAQQQRDHRQRRRIQNMRTELEGRGMEGLNHYVVYNPETDMCHIEVGEWKITYEDTTPRSDDTHYGFVARRQNGVTSFFKRPKIEQRTISGPADALALFGV